MEILFTHSYFIHFDPKEAKAHMPYPPLGTITAAAALRAKGFSVGLHDVMLSTEEEEIFPVLQREHPRVVVIYDDSFNFLTKMCLSRMREAAFKLARFAREAGSTVIVFSSDASDHIEEYLSHDAQFVVCGEAEDALDELCHSLLRGTNHQLSEIAGIAFAGPTGSIVRTPRRPPIQNLDKIPMAAWDLVDLDRYREVWVRHHGYFSLNISTTRGCPFHCNWCAKPLYGQVYNSRSPEGVVEEMLVLKNLASPDHLWITDDIFGLRPGWIQTFDEIVNERDAKIPFKCLSRADLLLKEDTIRHLKSAGCHTVWVGAESGSQRVLDAMEKGTTISQIKESTRLLHSVGIRVGFFLQFGYPGETRDDIEKTLQLVKDCAPDEIGISVSYPLPGTPFHERVAAQLGDKQNWDTSADFDPMFQATFSKEYYRMLHRVVHKKFSIWRGVRAFERLSRKPKTIDRRALRSLASLIVHSLTLPHHLLLLRNEERSRGNHGAN